MGAILVRHRWEQFRPVIQHRVCVDEGRGVFEWRDQARDEAHIFPNRDQADTHARERGEKNTWAICVGSGAMADAMISQAAGCSEVVPPGCKEPGALSIGPEQPAAAGVQTRRTRRTRREQVTAAEEAVASLPVRPRRTADDFKAVFERMQKQRTPDEAYAGNAALLGERDDE